MEPVSWRRPGQNTERAVCIVGPCSKGRHLKIRPRCSSHPPLPHHLSPPHPCTRRLLRRNSHPRCQSNHHKDHSCHTHHHSHLSPHNHHTSNQVHWRGIPHTHHTSSRPCPSSWPQFSLGHQEASWHRPLQSKWLDPRLQAHCQTSHSHQLR